MRAVGQGRTVDELVPDLNDCWVCWRGAGGGGGGEEVTVSMSVGERLGGTVAGAGSGGRGWSGRVCVLRCVVKGGGGGRS